MKPRGLGFGSYFDFVSTYFRAGTLSSVILSSPVETLTEKGSFFILLTSFTT